MKCTATISKSMVQRVFLPLLLLATSRVTASATPLRAMRSDDQMAALDYVLNMTVTSAFEAFNTSLLDIESMPAVQSVRQTISSNQSSSNGLHTQDELAFLLNGMLHELYQDAHFRVEVNEEVASTEYCHLDLCLAWLQDGNAEPAGLVNTCQTDYAEVGDEIIELGGILPRDIFARLESTIPHENIYFLQGLPSSWLVREDFLSLFEVLPLLGYSNETFVTMTVSRDGAVLPPVMVPLTQDNERSTSSTPKDSFVTYELMENSSVALFTLNECIFNETFTTVLTEFWSKVHEEGVDAVVLDLRNNRGGDATVVPAFLNHLDVPFETVFSIEQRQSEAFCREAQFSMLCDPAFLAQFGIDASMERYNVSSPIIGALLGAQAGEPPVVKFSGDLFVLTSGTTFSSANLFAMTIQDNQLGTVVGTPTGSSLTFHGNLVPSSIPHTNLTLFLTTSFTKRETIPGAPETVLAVIPDHLVVTTPRHLAQGIDPQLAWVNFLVGPSSQASSGSVATSILVEDQTLSPTIAPISGQAGTSPSLLSAVFPWVTAILVHQFVTSSMLY